MLPLRLKTCAADVDETCMKLLDGLSALREDRCCEHLLTRVSAACHTAHALKLP